jgi:hypothetical protein
MLCNHADVSIVLMGRDAEIMATAASGPSLHGLKG